MKLIVKLLWYLIELWRWEHRKYDDEEYDQLKQEVEDYLNAE